MKTRSGLLPFCSTAKNSSSSSSSSSSSLLGCQNRSLKSYPHLVIRTSNNGRQIERQLLMESGVSVAADADAGTAATTTTILSRVGRKKRCSSSLSSPQTPTLSSSSFSVIAHLYSYLPLICLLALINCSSSSSSTILAANGKHQQIRQIHFAKFYFPYSKQQQQQQHLLEHHEPYHLQQLQPQPHHRRRPASSADCESASTMRTASRTPCRRRSPAGPRCG